MIQTLAWEDANRPGGPEMFDRIARRYDRMNRLLSLGLDRRWRRRLVELLGPLDAGALVLDVATGTGDVAIDIARGYPRATVVGLDPSGGMLGVGQKKVADAGLRERIELVVGDARALPFAEGHFAASCIAFGIRNVPERSRALEEMVRVTAPGGRVAVLELSEPRAGALGMLARFHIRHVVPTLGHVVTGHREYRYLQESIAAFPSPTEFGVMMADAGLVEVLVERQTMAVAHLYSGRVPA